MPGQFGASDPGRCPLRQCVETHGAQRRPETVAIQSVEQERFRELAAELASLHGVRRADLLDSPEVWKDLAHAVLNLKEFQYIR